MGFIDAARQRLKTGPGGPTRVDPVLCGKRPALEEFLTVTEGPEGGVRERSILMICVEEDGLRVGLKDEQLGGWLWRHGATLSEALTAIEESLVDGTAAFRGTRGARGRQRR